MVLLRHLFVLFLYAGLVLADLTVPRPEDGRIASDVLFQLQNNHLIKRPMEEVLSTRSLRLFIKSLDPAKKYFLQNDVDEFMKFEHEVAARLKAKDVGLAYQIYNRLLQRIDERVKDVDRLLEQPFDFSVDENLQTDAEKKRYARNEEEAQTNWRKYLKYELLLAKKDGKPESDAKAMLSRRYRIFQKASHQVLPDSLLERYLSSVTSSYDPHSNYMAPSSYENLKIHLRLSLDGIGAVLSSKDEEVIIQRVVPGGPAAKQGELKSGDRILTVGQDNGEMVDVTHKELQEVVNLIRGKAGTMVKLGIRKQGSTETRTIGITRGRVELKDAQAKGEVLLHEFSGRTNKIGVVSLPSFYMDMDAARRGIKNYKSSTEDIRKILDDFRVKGADAVVLDLRNNGGGSLQESINLTGLFIDRGPVVQVKDSRRTRAYADDDSSLSWEKPLVILVNKFSASASEILAGALQDYKRALVVGDSSTHGKGTVQTILELGGPDSVYNRSMGALKLTIEQFYRPGGDSTQKRGVLSDIVLPAKSDRNEFAENQLDYAMEFDHIGAARYTPYKMVNSEIIQGLGLHSTDRRNGSADFQKISQQMKRLAEANTRKLLPLNEAAFFAFMGQFDSNPREEESGDNESAEPKAIKVDFYLKEVLNIASEYCEQLQSANLSYAQQDRKTESGVGSWLRTLLQ
ncbi:MAG: carboxy terminal-processing peptidase [Deltaproteobacteria bacterium]|nr:carboxy terminal-processing peptidase [Deltaproteobacteria bacterium]